MTKSRSDTVTSGIAYLATVNLAKVIHEKLQYHRFKNIQFTESPVGRKNKLKLGFLK